MDELERENAALREQLAGRTEQLEVSIQNNALIKNGLLKRAERAEAELAKFTQAVGLATTIKGEMPIRPDDPIGMMHEVVEAASKLREERAKLRQHAEAMAEHWEKDDTMNMMQSAVDAYRRDYPEGTK